MNRRQRIIVSVTGIFIVLLILIGLTYAYFLTRITGNSNPTSISVTTANLELVYGDGTTAILTSSNPLMPSSKPIGTKDFTVTNRGDNTEYVVVFEDVVVSYAADTVINGENIGAGTTTTFESNDFVYTLTCTKKDGTNCNGLENETFPMNGGIVIGNNIDKSDVHNYVLTLYYLDNGLDQSADMNKTLNGKVNIKDIKSINPYSENKNSLAYNIINNSIVNKNGTELVSTPPSNGYGFLSEWKVVDKIVDYEYTDLSEVRVYSDNPNAYFGNCYYANECDEDIIVKDNPTCEEMLGKYAYTPSSNHEITYIDYCENGRHKTSNITNIYKPEQILATTQDDYGTSYYYRGAVEDNYVNFAGMCWKIVRIEGDGSIKLILEDKNTTCNDTEDTDGTGTSDYAYTGEWDIKKNIFFQEPYSTITNSKGETLDASFYKSNNSNFSSRITEELYLWLSENSINTSKLKKDKWCLGNTTDIFDSSTKKLEQKADDIIYNYVKDYYVHPIDSYPRYEIEYTRIFDYDSSKLRALKCTGKNYETFDSYAGTVIPAEIYLAGYNNDDKFKSIYDSNKSIYDSNFDFYTWWRYGMVVYSESLFEGIYMYRSNDGLEAYPFEQSSIKIRPSITLLSNTMISSGTGILSDPYVVE